MIFFNDHTESISLNPIRQIKKKSIFDHYPELLSIWENGEHANYAKESIQYWETNINETGGVYLINHFNLNKPREKVVVGIIGFWEISKYRAGIRWSGLLKEHRGKGYYLKALCSMFDLNTQYSGWFETAYSPEAQKYFEHIGFKVVTDQSVIDLVNGSEGSTGNAVMCYQK